MSISCAQLESSIIEQVENMFTLRDLVSGKAPDTADMRQIFLPVMKQLVLMHQGGVVHRAVNPDTIYRDDKGQWRLFALSELPDAEATDPMSSKRVPLTNAQLDSDYAPIELFSLDIRRQGPWTDIYSLGAVMYLCSAGHAPVGAKDRVVSGQPYDKATDPLLWLANSTDLRFDRKFARLVDRAMTYFHYDRPQTIETWAAAIFGASALANTKLPANRIQRKRLLEEDEQAAGTDKNAPLLTAGTTGSEASEGATSETPARKSAGAANDPAQDDDVPDKAQRRDLEQAPKAAGAAPARATQPQVARESSAPPVERSNAGRAVARDSMLSASDEDLSDDRFYAEEDEFASPDLYADEGTARYDTVDRSQHSSHRARGSGNDEGGWLAVVAGAILLIIALVIGIMFVNDMSFEDVVTIVKEETGLVERAAVEAPAQQDPSALPDNVQFSDPVAPEKPLGSGRPDAGDSEAPGKIDRESGFRIDEIETRDSDDESVESIVSFGLGENGGSEGEAATAARQSRNDRAMENIEARSEVESSQIRDQDDESRYRGPNLSQSPLRKAEAEAIVSRFRSALQGLDSGTINRIALLSERRHTYLNYLIESFVSSTVIGEVVQMSGENGTASANLIMTQLTDSRGQKSTPPSGLQEISVEILRGRDGSPVIHWR